MKNDGRFKPFSQEEFLSRAKLLHGNRYDYSKSIYVNGKTKITIGCKNHGDFKQAARKHLSGSGCVMCFNDSLRMPQSVFIELSLKKHNKYYGYELVKYETARKKVKITCPKHGVFEQAPHEHLNGAGCPMCARDTNSDSGAEILRKFHEAHGDKYQYECVDGKRGFEYTNIRCKYHGIFRQKIRSHIRGNGCPKCVPNGYSKSDFVDLCLKKKQKNPSLYLLKCYGVFETFYKIGITSNTVDKRFNNKVLMPYYFEALSVLVGSPEEIWQGELETQRTLSDFHYKPFIKFHGSTRECFSMVTPEILSFFGVADETA